MDDHDIHRNSGKRSRNTIRNMLRQSKLRPTRQRVALAELLFASGGRHISADELYEEAKNCGVRVSLATVYNTLNQFSQAGLLREIAVDGSKAHFDTNITDHHHFIVEGDNEIVDIADGQVTIGNVPEPPPGFEIARVDVVVRLRRLKS